MDDQTPDTSLQTSPDETGTTKTDPGTDSPSTSQSGGRSFVGSRSSGPSTGGGQAKGAGNKSFMQKHGKKLAVGGGAAAVAIPIIIFFFFMMLFKNVHIKQLFMDYEFAKFNRNFRSSLRQAANEAKAEGTGETVPDENLAPDEQMKAANAEEVDRLKGNPEAFEEAAKQAEALERSSAGTGGQVDADLGLERSVDDTTGKTDAEVREATETKFRDEVAKSEKAAGSKEAGGAKDVVEEGKKLVAAGEAGPTLKESLGRFAGKANSVVAKLTGPFIFATYLCIIRDIYVEGYKLYVSIKLASMGNFAAVVAKYADCQKQGACKMSEAAAISDQFDNGKESFTQTASYRRATNQPVTKDTPDLEDEFRPDYEPGGAIGAWVHAANVVSNAGISVGPVNLSLGDACSAILLPETQIVFAVVNIGTAIAAAATGVLDFGASDVAVIAVETGAQIAATKVGKALATTIALHYGGVMFKQHFTPIQAGNLMGAGSKVLASSTCKKSGCVPLTPQENRVVMAQIRDERIKADQDKGLAYRLFSPNNPYSNLSLAIDKVPTTPRSITASIQKFASSFFSPTALSRLLGQLGLAPFRPQLALADSNDATFGIPDYGFTDEQLSRWTIKENADFVRANKSDYDSYVDKCFKPKVADSMDDTHQGKNTECSDRSDKYLQYHVYRFRQRVTHSAAVVLSKTTAPATSGVAGAGGTGKGTVNAQGYSFPIGPQCQNCLYGVGAHQTVSSHSGGLAAFDIHGKGTYDTGDKGGLPVYAIHSGTIFHINPNEPGWCYGVTLHADDGAHGYSDGYTYWYGHLNNLTVKEKDIVTAGQIIGYTAQWTSQHNCPNALGEKTSGRSHLHIQRGCMVNGKPADVGFGTCELDAQFIPFLSQLYRELPMDLVATTTGAQVGTGKLDPTGYVFPMAPQRRSAIDGIVVGQTTSSHSGGLAAYDLFGPGHAGNKGGDKVYALSAGKVAFVQTKEAGWCYAIEFQSDDSFYYVYDHLNPLVVKNGDTLTKGQLIGYTAQWTPQHTCAGSSGSTHLHMNRGCVVDTKPQYGGQCMDPDFIPFLSRLYETLPN